MADYGELLLAANVSYSYSHRARSGPIAGDAQAAGGACCFSAGGINGAPPAAGRVADALAIGGGDADAALADPWVVSAGWLLSPVSESLKPRMPAPSDLPISGRRLAPNTSRSRINRKAMW